MVAERDSRGWTDGPDAKRLRSEPHLLRDTRSLPPARKMFLEIYNWFTEGFDTADLKEAKALLEELTDSRGATR